MLFGMPQFCKTFGCILGSIFGSCWEPSSPPYSFLVALVAKTGLQKPYDFRGAFLFDFGAPGGRGVEGRPPGETPGETVGETPGEPPPALHHAG